MRRQHLHRPPFDPFLPPCQATTEFFSGESGQRPTGAPTAIDGKILELQSNGKGVLAQTSGLTHEAVSAMDKAVLRHGQRRRSMSDASQASISKAIGTLGAESAGTHEPVPAFA